VATLACRRRASACRRPSAGRSRRQLAGMRRSNSARLAGQAARRFPRPCGPLAERRACAPGVENRRTESRRAVGQPSALRVAAISSAPSGEPCTLLVPALVGAPKPMVVLQAISVGGRTPCALRSPRKSRRDHGRRGDGVPAEALKRASWSVESASDTAPSMVMLLSSQSTISLLSFRWPASDRLLADAFHQAAVAGQHIGVVIDEIVAELGVELALGDGHADGVGDALAERAGGGLDAGGVAIFGVAGGLRAELAEILDLVDRHVLVAESDRAANRAASSRGRPTARSGRGPASSGRRIELHDLGEQHRGDVGRAHRQAGMAGIGLLDRIHGQGADGVGHSPSWRR
jgi:hypothetical protein